MVSFEEFGGSHPVEGRVRPALVVVEAPGFDRRPGMEDRWERVFVEQFVSKAPVETLDDGVLIRLTGLDEVQLDAGFAAPLQQLAARKVAAIVGLYGRR